VSVSPQGRQIVAIHRYATVLDTMPRPRDLAVPHAWYNPPIVSRPRPTLFNLCSALSLLLCIILAALWVRSYWHGDCLVRIRAGGGCTWIALNDGRLAAAHDDQFPFSQSSRLLHMPMRPDEQLTPPLLTGRTWFRAAGFELIRDNPGGAFKAFVPGWAVFTPTTLLPLLWLSSHQKRLRRQRTGFCRRCGYDLRATPDRCPECGTPAPASVARHGPGAAAPPAAVAQSAEHPE
jgi:hypothetical protein